MEEFRTSDWVLVITTLFLAAIALVVPAVTEWMKRRLFSPILKIEVKLEPPHCHKTKWASSTDPALSEPVYYFRLGVVNDGQTQARLVEAVQEELWIYDSAGNPRKQPSFSAMNVHWSGNDPGQPFVNINPKRRLYLDIGHISSIVHQQRQEAIYRRDIPGMYPADVSRFVFDWLQFPYSQPNCLVPGRYAIKLVFYSENAPRRTVWLRIDWSGRWHDTESEMFRELVIQSISPMK